MAFLNILKSDNQIFIFILIAKINIFQEKMLQHFFFYKVFLFLKVLNICIIGLIKLLL
jgi:hypothetical protein